jgi:hypothetical protein
MDGIEAGARVIACPSDAVHDGVRVRTSTRHP